MSTDNFVIQNDVLVEYTGDDERVNIPYGVRKIGEWAFKGQSHLKKVLMHDGIEKIDKGAFFECASLESVHIPSNVNIISYSAFRGCKNLVSVEFWDGVDASEKIIDECAFAECEKLESIILSVDVVTIGDDAFRGCTNLKYVCYLGDEEDFFEIEIGNNNECFRNATVYFYSNQKPREKGNFWYYKDGKPQIWDVE